MYIQFSQYKVFHVEHYSHFAGEGARATLTALISGILASRIWLLACLCW